MIYPEPTNDERAERAHEALMSYVQAKGDVLEENNSEIGDLIADLLHLARKWNELNNEDESVEQVIRLGKMHYDAEVDEESDSDSEQETV